MTKKPRSTAPATRIIRTKLAPPRTPRHVVQRPGILEALDLGCGRVLTVVQAPAGFGKSTVLTEWRNRLLERRRIVAWVTLDEDDNDPAQFAAYLTRALGEALGSLVDHAPEFTAESETASPKVRLTSVINALDPIEAGITLILDDYDRIQSPSIQDLLSFLLLRAPANLSVVIATRSEPPLPLAYLRAHDELVEVGPELLRFDLKDTRQFFASASPVKLDAAQARTLFEATEGWIAGLQIASIALRGQADAGQLIAGFSGKFKAVNAYLGETVLPNLEAGIVDVLLRTSILERFNGPLCEAVAGVPAGEGAARLLQLHQQNLFLQALDDENRWFRYHALFRDFLRAELDRRLPGESVRLHTAAAQWFAEAGFWAEAVRHALAADRLDLASDWVERCAMREVEDSRVHELLAWVRKLPPASVRTRRRLRLAMAWALMLTLQLDEAMAIVDDLSARLGSEKAPSAALDTELLALRFCIIALRDETAAALPLGEQCLQRLATVRHDDEQSVLAIQAFLNGLTHCYQKAGRVDEARAMQASDRYPLLRDPSRNLVTQSYRAILLSACDLREGKLHQGAREMREALRLTEMHAGSRSAAATMIACSLAAVQYEWNDLDKADELLADRLDIVDEACYLDSVRLAYLTRARAAAVRGDDEGAHSMLDRAEHIAARRAWTRLTAVVLAERVRLWLQAGRPLEAEAALQRLENATPASAPTEPSAASETWRVRCLARARWLLHLGQHADAVTLLRAVLTDEDPIRSPYPCARVRVLLAVALSQAGQREAARDEVRLLLALGELSGMVRSIADDGAPIASLVLQELGPGDAGRPASAWRASLRGVMEAHRAASAEATPTSSTSRATAGAASRDFPIEPLSARERDILSLIARGMSNEQAARALRLGTETVKWHLKNVYSKLGVSRRTLAVHRARKLDLIGDRDD